MTTYIITLAAITLSFKIVEMMRTRINAKPVLVYLKK